MNDPVVGRRFVCLACGWIHLTWAARCTSCLSLKGLTLHTGHTGSEVTPPAPPPVLEVAPVPEVEERPRLTIARLLPDPELTAPVEELVDLGSSGPVPISDIAEETFIRDSTGMAPLDHVLGGGLVAGSVVLLASPPGIGKSSLTLQMLAGLGHRCLYVTGEETKQQIAGTARRIGALSSRLYVFAERSLAKIFAHARAMRAQTIAIDSIQKMLCEDINGRPGSPGQLKECTARLVDYAKTNDVSMWIIGHVTADEKVAGPKTIEHDVDVVLELSSGGGPFDPWSELRQLASEQPDLLLSEGLRIAEEPGFRAGGNERILRCSGKNRFGPTNVVGRFQMTDKGLAVIDPDGWNEPL